MSTICGGLVALCALAADPPPAAPPGPAEIAAWIEQLGADQFARREAAARSLVAAGRPALGPLAAAIRADDLEISSRGIEVVREMLGGDPELAAEAEGVLEACAEGDDPSVARLAGAVLDFHHAGMESAARERLESLGALFVERPLPDRRGLEVEFGAAWKGTADDVRQLTRLRRLVAVGFHGVPVDERIIGVLGRLGQLERVELFGTGADEERVAALAARLPDTRFDLRKGGKLGVGAIAFGGPCELRVVEPGSAADQAGVRAGDVVLAVDGVPIADFDALTARVAGRGPGEVVRLSVARRGGDPGGDAERLEFEVRLDAW